MWNDLRDQDDQQQDYFQEDAPEGMEDGAGTASTSRRLDFKAMTREPILGMTAPQRFVIATMLFMAVCILGSMFMLITEKFVLF